MKKALFFLCVALISTLDCMENAKKNFIYKKCSKNCFATFEKMEDEQYEKNTEKFMKQINKEHSRNIVSKFISSWPLVKLETSVHDLKASMSGFDIVADHISRSTYLMQLKLCVKKCEKDQDN